MPPTPARPHETELLLCGHHYRVPVRHWPRRTAGLPPAVRPFYLLFMEPGSLIMERKMLLGIKTRAERLARDRAA